MAGFTPEQLRMFAIRQERNEQTTLGFMITLGAIGLAYIVFYLIRQSGHWVRRTSTNGSKSPSMIGAMARKVRQLTIQRAVGVPSVGHATITTLFMALNLICLFGNLDSSMNMTSNIASRTGWLAIANLVVVIFFALKNTPLAILTSWSYERLNCLHRISGYAAVTHVIIHAACYTAYFYSVNFPSKLVMLSDIYGIVSGACWVLLALAAVFIRPRWYELFYYIHVGLWVVSIVTLGLHQPFLRTKIVYGTVIAGSMWGLDRIIRFARLMLHSSNTATLTPLPNGGTRVTLAQSPVGAHSGKHGFLWIPRLRLFETHPLTIASTDPLEFVVASYSGFTADLHQYALENPGVPLKASIEGPYGTVPDPSVFDTVVFVAGGSGASFTFGLANALLKRATGVMTKRVVFVWVVKYHSYLSWFAHHLANLNDDPRFAIQVFVTRSEGAPTLPLPRRFPHAYSPSSRANSIVHDDVLAEKEQIHRIRPMGSDSSIDLAGSQRSVDVESVSAEVPYYPADLRNIPVRYHKPNVAALIRDVVGGTRPEERLLITGCGPTKLMDLMRETTVECIRSTGPSIELHCEEFGW